MGFHAQQRLDSRQGAWMARSTGQERNFVTEEYILEGGHGRLTLSYSNRAYRIRHDLLHSMSLSLVFFCDAIFSTR
jgi:hypothetical protein